MTDLVAFLRARLDETAAKARAASEPESWIKLNREPLSRWAVQYWADPDRAAVIADPEGALPVVVTPQGMDDADAEARVQHIAHHDPARVLAEVDAMRRVMECHESWEAGNGDTLCGRCGREHIDGRLGGHFPCQTLRLLALPYGDHPDYREEWRP